MTTHVNRVLDAIRSGKLPRRAPDRAWGGVGYGSPCAICGQLVRPDELEFQLEFATGNNGEPPDHYHVHLACYSAWKAECRKLELSAVALSDEELSGGIGETRVGADDRDTSSNQGAT